MLASTVGLTSAAQKVVSIFLHISCCADDLNTTPSAPVQPLALTLSFLCASRAVRHAEATKRARVPIYRRLHQTDRNRVPPTNDIAGDTERTTYPGLLFEIALIPRIIRLLSSDSSPTPCFPLNEIDIISRTPAMKHAFL